jgi:prepilin-type N-terminal cleavage/methylation domain-containing protein
MWGDRPGRHLPSSPRAFTLVELLVVIGIIGLLAAIITPVVMQSLTKARNAAIKAEIDMLHMAIMNYKNEYGSFPPCADANPSAPLTSGTMTSSAQKHLARIFPRCSTISGPSGQFAGAVALTPANAIYSWLCGYTTNPTSPLQPSTDRKKLYDFDAARVSGLQYAPSGKTLSPYIYIRSGTNPIDGYGLAAGATVASAAYGVYRPQVRITTSGTECFNSDTFQILCAGRDEIWSEDSNLNGALDAGEDLNGNNQLDTSDDDLSNFWPGTRREYLDSLKD